MSDPSAHAVSGVLEAKRSYSMPRWPQCARRAGSLAPVLLPPFRCFGPCSAISTRVAGSPEHAARRSRAKLSTSIWPPHLASTTPDLSPLHAPDVSSAAPALILPAHFDPLRDEAIRYAERLREAGAAVRLACFESLSHGFALMTRASPAAARAVQRVARDVGEALRCGRLDRPG
jgi:acetyl esterase/lipase